MQSVVCSFDYEGEVLALSAKTVLPRFGREAPLMEGISIGEEQAFSIG
jgi:hypothetical protein